MKVGLVRHFKVKRGYPEKRFITPRELYEWIEEYDASDIELGQTDLCGIAWKRCFSSDLPRAFDTAASIYSGSITRLEELREVKVSSAYRHNFKLPFILYPTLGRLAWLLKRKSQLESKEAVEQRVKKVLDRILAEGDEDVLIVSHGALMIFLRRELLKRGFKGPNFRHAENGKLYLFSR